MTPEDLARLTEEERALASDCLEAMRAPDHRLDDENILMLLTRLALARRVVEAARESTAEHFPPQRCKCRLCASLAAHDAEVGG